MEAVPSYEELKLRIEKGSEDAFRVRAEAADGSSANADFQLPFDDTMLENFVLRVGRPRHGGRGSFGSTEMDAAKEFGDELFNALVHGKVREVYQRARERASAEERGLRITLNLSDVPSLQHVPWEFLYDFPMFLGHSIETPIVRSLDLESVRRPRRVRLPLRILGMDSRPHGAVPLDADQERQNLESAIEPLRERGLVELEWLPRATLRELQRRLDRPDEFHIFHYIGHGAYDAASEMGTVLLENRDGNLQRVSGPTLGSVLYDESSLRLAVLNACEGARNSQHDPFSGVAASLVACGIPAVVGMQFEITDGAAVTFAEQLYASLAEGYPVDVCLSQARRAIWADGHDTEFGTPVLYLRAADARLFEVEDGAAQPPPPPPPAEPEEEPRCELTLRLDQRPGPGGELVSWRLTIQNSGDCALEDISATGAGGEELAAPFELEAGQRRIIGWQARPPASAEEITVSAADARGTRLLERVAVEGAPQAKPEPAAEPKPAPEPKPAAEPKPTLAIPRYDSLTAAEIRLQLPQVPKKELPAIRAYEEAHEGRVTVIRSIDAILSGKGIQTPTESKKRTAESKKRTGPPPELEGIRPAKLDHLIQHHLTWDERYLWLRGPIRELRGKLIRGEKLYWVRWCTIEGGNSLLTLTSRRVIAIRAPKKTVALSYDRIESSVRQGEKDVLIVGRGTAVTMTMKSPQDAKRLHAIANRAAAARRK